MLRLFEKVNFCGCKSQISFIGNQTAGHGDRITEAWGGSEGRRDRFADLEVILRIRRFRR